MPETRARAACGDDSFGQSCSPRSLVGMLTPAQRWTEDRVRLRQSAVWQCGSCEQTWGRLVAASQGQVSDGPLRKTAMCASLLTMSWMAWPTFRIGSPTKNGRTLSSQILLSLRFALPVLS